MRVQHAVPAFLAVFAVACHHNHHVGDQPGDPDGDCDGPGCGGDNDHPRPQLTPYACDLETTATTGPEAILQQILPGTTQAFIIGATDAGENGNPYIYDYASGVITVLANGGPAFHSANPPFTTFAAGDVATGIANTAVALLYNGDVRMPHAYAVHTDGRDAVRLGDPAYGVIDAFFSADKTKLLALLRNTTDDQQSFGIIDIATGAQTTLVHIPATQESGYLAAEAALALTPDGSHFIYVLEDIDTADNQRLMSITTDGSNVVTPLSPASAGHQINIGSYGIAPSSGRVYYTADVDSDSVPQLYAVNADGTNSTRLSQAAIASDIGVTSTQIMVSGDRVVYLYGHSGAYEVDVVGITGSGRKRLDTNGLDFFGTGSLVITPAGDAVAFVDALANLVIAKLDGSGASNVSGDVTTVSFVLPSAAFAGNRVVYLRNDTGHTRLWASDLDGGNPHDITPPGTAATADMAVTTQQQWLTSGNYVLARRRSTAPALEELFSIDATTGTAVNMTPAAWPAGASFTGIAVGGDGGVVATAYTPVPSTSLFTGSVTTQLTMVPRCAFDALDAYFAAENISNSTVIAMRMSEGAAQPRLLTGMHYDGTRYQSAAISSAGLLELFPVYVTDDGSQFATLVYTSGVPTLYVGSSSGGALTSVALPPGSLDVQDPQISPDKSRIAFIAGDPSDLHSYFLWTTALDGSDAHKVSQDGAFISSIIGSAYRFTSDGRLVFRAAVPPCSFSDAYIANADGSNLARLTPSACANIQGFQDPTHGFDKPLSDGTILYATAAGFYQQALDGSAARLITPVGAHIYVGGTTGYVHLTPDGMHLLYLIYNSGTTDYELWTVPFAGGTAVKLSTGLLSDGARIVSPDGTHIAFETHGAAYETGIAVAPTDGSSGAVTLVAPKKGFINIFFAVGLLGVTNDTVYIKDTTGIVAAPITGGDVQTLQAVNPIQNGNEPQMAPDRSEILFYDDLDQANVVELYSLKIADKSVTRVLPPLRTDGYVGPAIYGPNGSLLVLTDSGGTPGVIDVVEVR